MRLTYQPSQNGQKPFARGIVLGREQQRVELFIKASSEETYTLLAFSGGQGQPVKQSRQGPYSSVEQGQAAAQAIVNELARLGFEQLPVMDLPRWEMIAQHNARALQNNRAADQSRYDFHPADVLTDPHPTK